MVAENNKICFCLGHKLSICFISSINPISSMRSASSSTKISTWLKSTISCLCKSISLPGVATKISTPLVRTSIWGSMDVPPKITVALKLVCLPYALKLFPICKANSLVGLTMSALIFLPPLGASCFSNNNCNMGNANAAVFPVPVCAEVITSFFARTNGMVFCCTSVGMV